MAQDINYDPKQNDSMSPEIIYQWWCEKCCGWHYGLYDCPYDDIEYCPHCGQAMPIKEGWT